MSLREYTVDLGTHTTTMLLSAAAAQLYGPKAWLKERTPAPRPTKAATAANKARQAQADK